MTAQTLAAAVAEGQQIRADVRAALMAGGEEDTRGELVDAIVALCRFTGGQGASIVAGALLEAAKDLPR